MRFYTIEERKEMKERLGELEQLERTEYREIPERKILPRKIELAFLRELKLNQIYN